MRKIYNFTTAVLLTCTLPVFLFIFAPTLSLASSLEGAPSGVPEMNKLDIVCEPLFSNVPGNITVQCDAVPPPAQNVTATPTCCGNPNVTIVFNEVKKLGNICGDDYTLTRTWTATDACGNVATATQVVKVIDTVPPVFVNPPGDVSVECSSIPSAPVVVATDNCDQNVFMILVETQLPGPCYGTYNLSRLWVARDNCDNATPHVQIVTVTDTKGPSFTKVPN